MADIDIAVKALVCKQQPLKELFGYYEGDQPVVYLTERLREIFAGLSTKFTANWCEVVIGALADRIQIMSWSVASESVPNAEAAQKALTDAWRALSLSIEADDAHEAALVGGESAIILWGKDTPSGREIQACYNNPRCVHVEYAADNPRVKLWAAKWWDGSDGKKYLTLYYPDRIEYYRSKGAAVSVTNGDNFEFYIPEGQTQANPANPYGVIPVFHLRNKRCASELKSVLPLQNGINKLLIDMMAGAEFAALPQKWAVTNADTKNLQNGPGQFWAIPAADGESEPTKIGQFEPADLKKYFDSIDGLVSMVSSITRTPAHYFFRQGGTPSGEALVALEAPLNKKASDRIERFTPVWREVGAFLLLLLGQPVPASAVEPVFERPETVQPVTQSEIRERNVKSGIPLRTQLRDEGWTDAELAQLDADRSADAAAQQASLASALVDARTRFDQGL